ncbi:hypothetical protein V6Z12_D08G199600 [Gossypium hirsutum]
MHRYHAQSEPNPSPSFQIYFSISSLRRFRISMRLFPSNFWVSPFSASKICVLLSSASLYSLPFIFLQSLGIIRNSTNQIKGRFLDCLWPQFPLPIVARFHQRLRQS